MLESTRVTGPPTGAASAHPSDLRRWNVDRAFRTGLIARLGSIASNLATVPIALASLGNSDFGVWSAITSTLALMAFLDFGIGNGVMGRITEALARDDADSVRRLLRNAYALLGIVALLVAALTFTAYASGAFQHVAEASGSFLASHVGLTTCFLLSYCVVVPASLVQRLLFAYQRAGLATLLQLGFSLLYLAIASAAWHWKLGLDVFVLGYVVAMIVVYGIATIVFLTRVAPPDVFSGPLNPTLLGDLLRDGSLFFLLQLTVALVYNSDLLILSSFTSPSEVAVYGTVAKIFSVITSVNGLMLGPMWPAYADARARGDWSWIRFAYYRSMRQSFAVSVSLVVALLLVGQTLVSTWTNGRIDAPIWLLAGMGVWVVLEGYGQCMAMLLNAARVVRLQLVIAIALLIVGVGLKVILSLPFGLYGPLLGTILSFVFVVALFETRYIQKLLELNR